MEEAQVEMKIIYINRNFHKANARKIRIAQDIIDEYLEDGYSLTMRQLYYQFVARDLIPNKMNEYKKLVSLINGARLAGLISWEAIIDRTRNLNSTSTWDSPADLIDAAIDQFKLDFWKNQPWYIEVWVEKDALIGVLEPVCKKYRVPYFACRGNVSQSEQWAAGERFAQKIEKGKAVRILHLGDHDPSGIDMTRDNEKRLNMFVGHRESLEQFEILRIALNMDQVEKYRPPPNPAKKTDSRYKKYAVEYGKKSWELDALEPKVISSLIDENIKQLIDQDAWDKDVKTEEKAIEKLKKMTSEFR